MEIHGTVRKQWLRGSLKTATTSFNSTPVRITEPEVKASACDSGSQIWKEIIANLTEKPRKK